MRSTSRFNRFQYHSRKINYSTFRKMTVLLQTERHHHQRTVAELRTILNDERIEVNVFLKDMRTILNDMERQWPNASAGNIHSRHAHVRVPFKSASFSVFLLILFVFDFYQMYGVSSWTIMRLIRDYLFGRNGRLLTFISRSYRWIMHHILST